MSSQNYHRGPWQDTQRAAIDDALAEVNVSPGDFIECEYSDGCRMEPIDPGGRAIDVEVVWSEVRQQFKAILRRQS